MGQQPGLRFDIYERIMLSDEAESIRELDGMELIPHIQVLVEGEQAVVKGYLQLEGTYVCVDESRSSVSLQHTIPVEITLPMNKVSSVEQIAVEIEHFDVDLLSSRSLNVTGVLSLQGIEMHSNTPANDWREEEEVIFVHEAESETPEPLDLSATDEEEAVTTAAPWLLRVPAAAYQQNDIYAAIAEEPSVEFEPEPVQPFYEEYSDREDEYEAQPDTTPVEQSEVYQTEETVVIASTAPKPREEIVVDTYEDLTLLDHYEETGNEQTAVEENSSITDLPAQNYSGDSGIAADPDEEADDVDREMKIAFGTKRSDEGQSSEFKSYLHKNEPYRSIEAYPQKQVKPIVEETSPTDALEWKKLFLSESEDQKFKKVKMVIVQKEETLETIARRYDRKPQEIKLYNRLQEHDLNTGQVIYIP